MLNVINETKTRGRFAEEDTYENKLLHEEFGSAVDKIAGNYRSYKKFRDKDSCFETYNIPFNFEGENFYLVKLNGQGESNTFMTEVVFQEHIKHLRENNYFKHCLTMSDEEVEEYLKKKREEDGGNKAGH